MLPFDAPLPTLLGVQAEHLTKHHQYALKPAPVRGVVLFVQSAPTPKPRAPAPTAATRTALSAPDGLQLSVSKTILYLTQSQVLTSTGTSLIPMKGGEARLRLGARCVLRLRGLRRRWVLDVIGTHAALYEDRSPRVLPTLGRPPVEAWIQVTPMPNWLSALLMDTANSEDRLAPLITVGLLLRHAGTIGAGTPTERLRAALAGQELPGLDAVRWLAAAVDGIAMSPVVDAVIVRADALSEQISGLSPHASARAVAICAEREGLAALMLTLRVLGCATPVEAALARVDAIADSHITTLDDALSGLDDLDAKGRAPTPLPAALRHAPDGWWAAP